MSNIKALEKQIINNSIKPLGGGLPQTFNDIDKLPYVFSKPTVIAFSSNKFWHSGCKANTSPTKTSFA